jgi:SAM-dependent methyltransferase
VFGGEEAGSVTGAPNFIDYAAYYDLVNQGKDYAAECRYVLDLAEVDGALNILELGCGTGGHAEQFARLGHSVFGVDLSAEMIRIASERRAALPGDLADHIDFAQGDLREFRSGAKYDLVVSLFHVMSYQVTNQDLRSAFECARAHLDRGGLFVFDFWHGPGVLHELPESRQKTVADKNAEVTRRSTPNLDPSRNRVDVHFDIEMKSLDSGQTKRFDETHSMRYLFIPEIEALSDGLFRPVGTHAWLGDSTPGLDDWLAVAVLEAT